MYLSSYPWPPMILSEEMQLMCPALCGPKDCSLLGSSVHGIFQARILEWVATSFSRRSSWPRSWTRVSHIVGKRFTVWATREVHLHWQVCQVPPRCCTPTISHATMVLGDVCVFMATLCMRKAQRLWGTEKHTLLVSLQSSWNQISSHETHELVILWVRWVNLRAGPGWKAWVRLCCSTRCKLLRSVSQMIVLRCHSGCFSLLSTFQLCYYE